MNGDEAGKPAHVRRIWIQANLGYLTAGTFGIICDLLFLAGVVYWFKGNDIILTPGLAILTTGIFLLLALFPSMMALNALLAAFRDPRYRYLRNPGGYAVARGAILALDKHSSHGEYLARGRFQAASGENREFAESLGRSLGDLILARWDRKKASGEDPKPEPGPDDNWIEKGPELREMSVWVLYSRDPRGSGGGELPEDHVPTAALVGIPTDIIERLKGI
jgi:hypothetical protein